MQILLEVIAAPSRVLTLGARTGFRDARATADVGIEPAARGEVLDMQRPPQAADPVGQQISVPLYRILRLTKVRLVLSICGAPTLLQTMR